MRFSVLMSLYAAEQPEFLRACLTSLVMQSQTADEIVVVLDGKLPENLMAVLREFQAALPLKTVPLAENVGLGHALNIGLQHCVFDWVFRMDTDDIALPERFALQCAFLQKHDDVVLLGGQILEFLDKPNLTHAARRVPCQSSEIKQFSQWRNPFNHMTVAYRKEVVLRVGGYIHHLYMEDYHLWLRLLAAGFQAANLPDNLVLARTGAGMLTRRRGWQYIKSEWQLFRLKRSLNRQSLMAGLYCLALRVVPRMLPEFLLKKIYQLIHLK